MLRIQPASRTIRYRNNLPLQPKLLAENTMNISRGRNTLIPGITTLPSTGLKINEPFVCSTQRENEGKLLLRELYRSR